MDRTTEKSTEQEKHTLQLQARRHLTLAGVTDVKSFDEETVELVTDCGSLTVEGESLRVGTLDIARGAVEVTGRIGGLYYSDGDPAARGRRRGK